MNHSTAGSTAQFLIVLLIFAGVLAVTFFVTKWMAGYQKNRRNGTNIELIESAPLTSNKHIQILRIGRKYVAVAVSKDTVAMLTELTEDEITVPDGTGSSRSFRDIIAGVRTADNADDSVCSDEDSGADE